MDDSSVTFKTSNSRFVSNKRNNIKKKEIKAVKLKIDEQLRDYSSIVKDTSYRKNGNISIAYNYYIIGDSENACIYAEKAKLAGLKADRYGLIGVLCPAYHRMKLNK